MFSSATAFGLAERYVIRRPAERTREKGTIMRKMTAALVLLLTVMTVTLACTSCRLSRFEVRAACSKRLFWGVISWISQVFA